jgi:hypothetical protein
MRLLFIIAALALGCGAAQHSEVPNRVLTDGATPRQATEKDSWCQPPSGFPLEIMLIQGDLCWIELDATPARCAQLIREERWPHMSYGGRCWYFHSRKPKRQPTSSSSAPLGPVTTQ